MPHMKVSTSKADYVLQFHDHDTGTLNRKKSLQQLEAVDAIVLETGFTGLQELLDVSLHACDPQYDHAYQYARQHVVPIFGVDILPSLFDYSIRKPLSGMFSGIFTTCFFYYVDSVGEGEIPERPARKYAELIFLMQSPIIAARDAITAEKVEKYVVPHVRALTGKQRPTISLHYGTAHVGIRYDLESQLRRKITLWNLRNLNIHQYGGYKLDDLNTVAEAHYNGHAWDVTKTVVDPPLFV